MDNKQLVTIAVTAALSVVIKEIFASLLTWLKKTVVSEKIKNILKKAISTRVTRILVDVLALWNAVHLFRNMIRSTDPITRGEIVFITVTTLNLIFWGYSLFNDVATPFDNWLAMRIYNYLHKNDSRRT